MNKIGAWDETLRPELPKSWEKHGDLLLVSRHYFASDKWRDTSNVWSPVVCNLLKVNRIARKSEITNDDFRSPKVEMVLGKYRETYHLFCPLIAI